jgi:general secretion pathway protein C
LAIKGLGLPKDLYLSMFSARSQRANQILHSLIQQQATLARILTLVLMLFSAWLCGHLFWLFVTPQDGVERWTPSSVSTSSTEISQSQTDIGKLLSANLFGVESQDAPKFVEQVVEAPKTSLSLVLVGVVSSSDSSRSLAVIANRGSQETYGIGEDITGTRARLRNVLKDRVIIENQGRNETLMLEGLEYKNIGQLQESTSTSRQSNVQGNNPAEVNLGDLDAIRSAIAEDPQQFLKYIRLSQVNTDGKLVGYRVRPGSERALFDSVGLEDGDIAVELNGTDLTQPAAMGELWKTFGELNEINLTVERDGQRYDIYMQF